MTESELAAVEELRSHMKSMSIPMVDAGTFVRWLVEEEEKVMSKLASTFEKLYECVQTRPRPEDVAELVLEALGPRLQDNAQIALLERASKGSTRQRVLAYSSMSRDFHRPEGALKQTLKAAELFNVPTLTAHQAMDPDTVETFVRSIQGQVGKEFGKSNFLTDRINRDQRVVRGLKKGHRWYNKRFRLLTRLERKILSMTRERKKYLLTRVGKSAMATLIPFDEFSKDLGTACFIAYLSSRMSLRSVFTNSSQVRAYDEVADMLFRRCRFSRTTNWMAIAYIMPDKKVLEKVSQEEKGRMMGEYWNILVQAAELLREISLSSDFNRRTMIVGSGCDSSTWNQVAGGWNKAREHWMSLLFALHAEEILDRLCPGKVLRLMASDVVRWHQSSKGSLDDSLHPDTLVWRDLPAPWEVVAGEAECTKKHVEDACELHDVDKKSWVGPRLDRTPVPFTATPELVHGVAVSSPELALALRKAGVFSAKQLKTEKLPNFSVQIDESGAVIGASPM